MEIAAIGHYLVQHDADIHIFFVDGGKQFAAEATIYRYGLIEWLADKEKTIAAIDAVADDHGGIIIVVGGGPVGQVNGLQAEARFMSGE